VPNRLSPGETAPVQVAGEVVDFDESRYVTAKDRQHVSRAVPLGVCAVEEALVDAGLDSLDVMELAFDIEDRFKVQLPQIGTELISFTYGDLCRLVENQLAAEAEGAFAAPSANIPS